jgi:hypothetical protein
MDGNAVAFSTTQQALSMCDVFFGKEELRIVK